MVESLVVALWLRANLTAVQSTPFKHVRSEESHVRTLIADGYVRSATLKELVDTVEELSCVVYIATAVKLSQGMQGALLHLLAGSRETPILRVLVKTNLSRDEAIAVIAHELQHVVEAVRGTQGAAASGATAVFDALDPTARAGGDRKYETAMAVAVTAKVRKELKKAP